GPDLYINGSPTTANNNLVGDGGGQTGIVNGVNGNMVGTKAAPLNPLLGPLQDNGGPTPTRLPQAGSPLISAGIAAVALNPDGSPQTLDQRGRTRPVGVVEIGAVEVQIPTVT